MGCVTQFVFYAFTGLNLTLTLHYINMTECLVYLYEQNMLCPCNDYAH